MTALIRMGASPVWEVAGGYLSRPQIFNLGESERHQFAAEFLRFKVFSQASPNWATCVARISWLTRASPDNESGGSL